MLYVDYFRVGVTTFLIMLVMLGIVITFWANFNREEFKKHFGRYPRGWFWSTGVVTLLFILAYLAYPWKG